MCIRDSVHGVRSASGTFTEAAEQIAADNYKKILSAEPGIDPLEARDQAYLQAQYGALKPAIASGAITASLVSLFGATGIERVFANPTKGREVIKDFYGIFTRTGSDASKQFGAEFVEEGLDSTLQGILAQKTFDPKRSNIDIFTRGLHDGFLGGLSGAKIGGTTAFAQNFESWVNTKTGKRGIEGREVDDFAPDIEAFIRKHAEEFDIAEEDIPNAAKKIEEAMLKQYDQYSKEAEGVTPEQTEEDVVTPDDGLSEPVVGEDMLNQSFAEGKADAESGFTSSSITKYNRLKKEFGEEVASAYMEGFSSVDQTQLEKQLEDDTAPIGQPTTLRQEVKDESTPMDSTRYQNLNQKKAEKDEDAGSLDQARESVATNTIPEDDGTPRSAMEGVNPTDRDLMFVQSAAPTLGKTTEGNKLLIKTLTLAQNKKIEYQRVYAQLSAANPALDHPTLELQTLQRVDEMFREEVNALREQAKFMMGNAPEGNRFEIDD